MSSMSYVQCCRLCMMENGELIDLRPIGFDRSQEELRFLIKNYLTIQIKEQDVLPTTICRLCAERLRGFQQFKDDCALIQLILEDKFKNATVVHTIVEKYDEYDGGDDPLQEMEESISHDVTNDGYPLTSEQTSSSLIMTVESETPQSIKREMDTLDTSNDEPAAKKKKPSWTKEEREMKKMKRKLQELTDQNKLLQKCFSMHSTSSTSPYEPASKIYKTSLVFEKDEVKFRKLSITKFQYEKMQIACAKYARMERKDTYIINAGINLLFDNNELENSTVTGRTKTSGRGKLNEDKLDFVYELFRDFIAIKNPEIALVEFESRTSITRFRKYVHSKLSNTRKSLTRKDV